MDIRDLFDAEDAAEEVRDQLCHLRDTMDVAHLDHAHKAFRQLAQSLGYRVERIGDGINTGKPVVAGGV